MGCTPVKKTKPVNTLRPQKEISAESVPIFKDLNKICQEYSFKGLLGYGRFGQVFLAESKQTGQQVAIKALPKSSFSVAELMQEVEILSELNHPCISKYIGHYQTERYLYVVMEYCEGKQLYTKVIEQDKFSEEETMAIMEQLLRAISYCHSRRIVHRDLKPENVMYSADGVVKLIDFGLSIKLDGMASEELVGTAFYIAPEIVRAKVYTKASDIWSLGIMMYVLLTGCVPVPGQTFDEVIENVKKYKGPSFKQRMWDGISAEAKNLLGRMLDVNYERRITGEEALKHSWFSSRRMTSVSCNESVGEKLKLRKKCFKPEKETLETISEVKVLVF